MPNQLLLRVYHDRDSVLSVLWQRVVIRNFDFIIVTLNFFCFHSNDFCHYLQQRNKIPTKHTNEEFS